MARTVKTTSTSSGTLVEDRGAAVTASPVSKRTFHLAVTNLKGGVAKTTTAVNVAWGLVDAGMSCLVVDLDMQANATSDLGFDISEVRDNGLNMASVLRGQCDIESILLQYGDTGLWVAPSSKALTDAERMLSSEIGGEKRLSQKLSAVQGRFDVIIFDCGPNLNLLTINALSIADYLIIPVQTEYLAAHGTLSLLDTVAQVRDNYNPGLTILPILPTMYTAKNSQEQATLGELNRLVSDLVPIFEPVPAPPSSARLRQPATLPFAPARGRRRSRPTATM